MQKYASNVVEALDNHDGSPYSYGTIWDHDMIQGCKCDEGYHGVDVIRLAWMLDKELLVKSLNEAGLILVCQIHTTGGYLLSNEYIYCGAYDVAAHKQDFEKQLRECKDLIDTVNNGGFVNVHAGVDAWSNNEAVDFIEYCLKLIERSKISVTFETHRQRIFGSPFQTRELLSSSPKLIASLKLNADLSHWYCACERVFNEETDRDTQWWPNLLSSISKRCEYIHARFGWAQGPQMADPSAPECEPERLLQIKAWKTLVETQVKNKKINIFMSPEYGPSPYMAVLPKTGEPVASLPDAVSFTKKILEDMFESI